MTLATGSSTDSKWFGSGYLFGTQVIAPGSPPAPPSILLPSQVVSIQEASVDITIGTKELRGTGEDPEDVATGARKITGKVTTGRVNLSQLNTLAFGEKGGTNFVQGSQALAVDEPATIPSTPGPFVDTLVNAATFYEDKGVKFAGTRNWLQPLASGPLASGQYTYNPATGVYTFAGADQGKKILISYSYTTTTGHTLTVNNLAMGSYTRGVFECLLQNPNEGDQELLLFQNRVTKITFPIKQEDYVKMEIDFVSYADALGRTFQFLSSY